MNFSEYLKTCNSGETSLNEGVGGLLAASRTKEFHDWFKNNVKGAFCDYRFIPASEGEKTVEIRCEERNTGVIILRLDDNAKNFG